MYNCRNLCKAGDDIKTIFLDYYGTVVWEDGEVVNDIAEQILKTGEAESKKVISNFWWNDFCQMFENAKGEQFELQRVLEKKSLLHTIEHFHSTADAETMSNRMFEYWGSAPVFEDAVEFITKCSLPIYIVSNIDNCDIQRNLRYHKLKVDGVFTSEDARSYKPSAELFEYALKESGYKANEVIHIGDSFSSDVKGATAVGIQAIWLNRSGREVPEGVRAIHKLTDILDQF